MYLPTKGTLLKRSVKDFFDDVYAICFLIFFIKAYVVGTHLNFFFFDLGFTALSRIFHLYRADRSSKVGKNRSTRRKTT